ncbi:unnamed protein product [Rotaria sp. Silwood2]|nr:unnamed protein product [Rotaria sp. Silwood2]CAF4074168.1 unnamed protein product [Rotaria sp. Silwood2]
MDKKHFRFYIKVCTTFHTEPIYIYNELYSVFDDHASLLGTVQRWSKWFREGREEVEDELRPGRPVAKTASDNIEEVRKLIDDNPYITIGELQVQSGLTDRNVQ